MRVVHEELPPVEPAPWLAHEPEGRLVDGRAFLGDGEHADPLSARHGREQALATRRSRRACEQRGGDHRARHVRAREAGAAHLLEEEDNVDHGAAAAAVFHGDQEARPAEDGDLLPQRSRKAALAGHALRHDGRWTVALEEIAGGAHEKLLALGEVEVHGLAPSFHARASAGRPSPRVATVERRISEVPPAMVWPRLVWYTCWIRPLSLAQRESWVRGP